MTRIPPRSNGRRSAGSSTKAPTPWVTGTAVSAFIAATTSISMAHPAACRRSWRTCRRSEISSGGVARRLVINTRQLHFRQQRASLDRDGWRLEIGPGRRCLGHRCRRRWPYADEAFFCRAAGRGIMWPLLHAGRQNVLRRSSAPGRREKINLREPVNAVAGFQERLACTAIGRCCQQERQRPYRQLGEKLRTAIPPSAPGGVPAERGCLQRNPPSG
jgi:hypothetical protein